MSVSSVAVARRCLVALLLLLVATGTSFLTAAPAGAAVFDPLHLVHSEQVSGDFLMAGNGVLVCPADDGTPARAECLGAANRTNTFNNNRFAMAYADVDSDPTTYDSSSATVTLPAGSRVTYARLQWGGNRDGQQCGIGAPGAYPPGTSRTQPVRLTVGAGATTDVAPTSYTTDTTSIGYYSADADVTSAFAAAPSGAPVPVTVGNVFAPTGSGCFGGWSLVVVHTDDDAGCAADRRQVFVYDGHVRQGVTDAPIDVTASGFQVDGQPARVGVTAYEGDNGQNGDQLLMNGTALTDPATGSTSNFFNSSADGQLSPAYPNNFSVDAKKLDVPNNVIRPGDTSATLRITTTADAFMLQSLVLSVPVPALCLEKSVSPATAHVGDPLTWTLRVSNPTTTDAVDVRVDDPAVPSCNGRLIPSLPAGQSVTTTCTSVATADLSNVATATGTSVGGTTLSAAAEASVDVISPAIAVTKTASTATGVPGEDVAWTVAVQNTGDTALGPVRLDDTAVPACAKADVGPLAPGATATVTCTSTLGAADVTNSVTASGTDPLGLVVSAQATSAVAVLVPAVEVKVDAPGKVEPGDEAKVEVVVTNTGATAVAGGTVEVPGFPACDASGITVPAGRSVTETCTITVDKDVDTAVKVTVQPQVAGAAAGPLVRTSAPLTVRLKNVAATTGDADGSGSDGSGTSPGTSSGGSSGTNVSATSGAGVPGLPDTGSPAMLLPAVAGGLLALLGGGLLLVRRRRTGVSSD